MTNTLLSAVADAAATPPAPPLLADAAAALNWPPEAITTARAEGVADGAKAATARISAILSHAEAGGREALARHIAFNTDLTPEAAASLLAASPKATPPAPTSRLDALVPDPKVGVGTEATGTEAAGAGLAAAVDALIKQTG